MKSENMCFRLSALSFASSVLRKGVNLQCALKSDYYSGTLLLLLHVLVILISLMESGGVAYLYLKS